jgi:hypothetical protein
VLGDFLHRVFGLRDGELDWLSRGL